jgi:hypothetical protein
MFITLSLNFSEGLPPGPGLGRLPRQLSACPLLAIPALACAIGAFGHFSSPPLRVVSGVNAKTRVVYHCRVGDPFSVVRPLFKGASKIKTFRCGRDGMTINVDWPGSQDRFVGRFDDGKLVWAAERVSTTPLGSVTCMLNIANPALPVKVTSVGENAVVVVDDPSSSVAE